MDLGLLRAFLMVADHGHYGRAAQALNITQPTLTKQIQALEAQAGGRLFDRGRHGAVLTDLGGVLLPDAQALLRQADALSRRMTRIAGGEIGRLSVGFGLSSIDLAPRLVAAFRRRRPHAHITLDDMSSQAQLDRLKEGRLDVGFVRLPVDRGWGRLSVGSDRLALAHAHHRDTPPHDVTQLPQWVARHEFLQLVHERGPGLAGQINRLCTAISVRPTVIQQAHDLQTVLALVAAGAGAAFVPASAHRIAPSPVTIAPIRHPAAAWRMAVVWNRERLHPLTAGFLALVREHREQGEQGEKDEKDEQGDGS
ncbi:LysR substrate-binding domain-containing protein [Nonomuraea sp. NPDC050783]|uniref:LysR substrate-binding domain-containing protein n=1 Tax=Nonomuraea sp. NPDC050783 TaxID=3154634 RepID=UPI00346754C0